ncbi:unnamed protein product, partial [Candidula unifasciata]
TSEGVGAAGIVQTPDTSHIGLYDIDYDDPLWMKTLNITGDVWYNYSCQSFEVPSGFMKDIIEPTICCIGVVGIVITMVVLTRKYMSTSCNCYLTALAVGDLLFLLMLFARTLVDKLADCVFHFSDAYLVFNVYTIILQDICLYLTIGVTVMLAVERYIAVCHPMRTIGLCTITRARTIIVALFVVSFILRSPKFLDIEVQYRKTESTGRVLTISWAFPYDEKLYTYIVTVGLLTVLPLLALLILNIRIIQELRRSAQYLQCYLGADMRVRSVVTSEEAKITLMLVGVVLAFFVCHVPYMVYSIIVAFRNYDTHSYDVFTKSHEMKNFQHVCHSFLALRSSCNFVLYCWFSEKFWVTFKRIFWMPICRTKQLSLRPTRYNYNSQHSRVSSHTYLHRSSFINTRDTTC